LFWNCADYERWVIGKKRRAIFGGNWVPKGGQEFSSFHLSFGAGLKPFNSIRVRNGISNHTRKLGRYGRG